MSLVTEQDLFLRDIVKLLQKAWELELQVTGGELYRTLEQQTLYVKRGFSKTINSQHLKRLALDLQFFENGVWITGENAKKRLQELGDYWESLDRKNRWGGNFTSFLDTPHFERYY